MRPFMILTLFLLIAVVSIGKNKSKGVEPQIPVCNISVTPERASVASQAIDFFSTLFETSSWPARWNCGQWTPFHGWVYILSDLVIWLSYFLIPITLGYFVYRKKKEIPFRSVVLLFIVFILACGSTHLIDAAIFWWPAYKFSAFMRLLTAVVSFATVFALIRIAPQVADFKHPDELERIVHERTIELREMNRKLMEEANQRLVAEEKLKRLYTELELKTEKLQLINNELFEREAAIVAGEKTIKQLNQDLERKVHERTSELHAINLELEAFTYSVSHDLRAPLRAIDGYARILEEDYNDRIDAHGKRLISVISRNALHMAQLIDDLLEFSRTSRAELVKSTFNADHEVRKIASDLMMHETNRNVEVDVKPLHDCKGDINMLRQVWTNLISNALKYSRKNPEAKIEIGSSVENDHIRYYVKDNGVGFDMSYVDKLFGVFQRLHSKDQFEGTGVGLALVKRILDRHNGRIWVNSELNNGTVFYFSLPA